MSETPKLLPASLIAKLLGIPAEYVIECGALAWRGFQAVNYYDIEEVQEFAQTDEGKARIRALRRSFRKAIEESSFFRVEVSWRDNAGRHTEPQCLITDTGGKLLWIETESGAIIRLRKNDFTLLLNGQTWELFKQHKGGLEK